MSISTAINSLTASIARAVPTISKETKAAVFTKAYFATVGLTFAAGIAHELVPGGIVHRDWYASRKVTKE
jgi:hypothetical protein